jgi:hypothetical protein
MARSTRKKSSSFADRFDSLRSSLLAGSARASTVAAFAFVALLGVLVLWGVPKLRQRLDAQVMASAGPTTVDYTNAPGWFDGKRRAEVSERVAMAVGDGSVLDPNRLAKARASLVEARRWASSSIDSRLRSDWRFDGLASAASIA